MSTLRDDEIQTIEAAKPFDPQADTDGDDTDGTTATEPRAMEPTATPTPTAPTATATTRTPRRAARQHSRAASSRSTPRRSSPSYWEQRPLVVPRDEPGRFDDLLSERGRRAPRLLDRDPLPGVPPRPGGEPDRASAPTRATSRGARRSRVRPTSRASSRSGRPGATIVLQALHVNWHPLAGLLPRARGRPGQARAGERVLHPARLAGVRASITTRTTSSSSRSRARSGGALRPAARAAAQAPALLGARSASTGEPTDDLVLRAGDTLYLPRGWLHEAETSDDRLAAPDASGSRPIPGSTRRGTRSRRARTSRLLRRDVEHGDGDGLATRIADELGPTGRASAAAAFRRHASADPRGRPLAASRARAA